MSGTRFSMSVTVMGAALLLAACNSPFPWVDRSGSDGADDPDALAEFESARQLEQHLKRAMREQYGTSGTGDRVLDGEVPVDMDEGGLAPRSSDLSGTNLQEIGVDEADRLKSDGRYLYLLTQREPSAVPVRPVVMPRPVDSRIRILELADAPQSAREVASVELSGMRASGSYLLTGRDAGYPDLLVVLGRNDTGSLAADWFSPWGWRFGMTRVTLVDVDDPEEPDIAVRLSFDGHLVASRRIGETLYLITRHYPWVKGYQPYPADEIQQRENRRLLDAAPLSELLPGWRVDDGPREGYLASAKSCYLPPAEEGHASADIISIIAIDLRNPAGRPDARCIVGPTETLYMSRQALYLATTRHRYVIQPRPALVEDMVVYPPQERTQVHKFALTDAGPQFRGSASVEGHLGWEQGKKPFRMGERDDVLFIATSLGSSWSMDATTRLTVLAEDRASTVPRLKELAHLPNEKRPESLGLPGERLYAARFLGERGYLVTFRVTDPLYVLDLSDPNDPFIAGSLKIPGYSDYLHPVSEGVLLGIGKSAVAADSEWGDGRGAWYQGIKLALFDVSDLQRPRELDSLEIGGRGTESDALRDHHAVTWLPADRKRGRPARLALPVRLHEIVPTPAPRPPWQHYPWTHTGLYLFDIHDGSGPAKRLPGIVERGRMVVESAANGDLHSYSPLGDRALIRGDGVHYLHGDHIWSADWGDPESMIGPQ